MSPADLNTTITAWIAVGVSLISVSIAGLSLWRTRPKLPRWEAAWDQGDSSAALYSEHGGVRFVVSNRGAGVALDVQLQPVGLNLPPVTRAQVAFGQSVERWARFRPFDELRVWKDGEYVDVGSDPMGRTITMRLTWSEAPKVHVRRSRDWTYQNPTSSNEW